MSQPYERYPGQPPYGGWPPPSAPVPPGMWSAPSYYGAPPPPPPRRTGAVVAWTVAGVVLAVAVIAVIAVGGFRLGSTDVADSMAGPSTSPPADWAVIGDDEGLDAYAERCHDGTMDACDELYFLADPGSDYEYYALTCGGRVAPRDIQWCEFLE